jgi:two-component system sensor histidine kinase GlrK
MTFPIYRKLLVSFAGIIVLMMAANTYVLLQLNAVTETTSATFRSDARSINLAKQLEAILFDEERAAEKYLISRDSLYFTIYKDQAALFDLYTDSLYSMSPNPYEVGLIFRLRNGHRWLAENMERELRSKPASTRDELTRMARARVDTLEMLHATLDRIVRSNEQDVSVSIAAISEAMIRSSNVAWLVTGGTFLVALAIAILITRTIVSPMRTLIKGTEQIARGVFDPIAVQSNDEMAWLAAAVNDMSQKLKQINDLKTEMLHHISHELRTPLQTMLSAQYLLSEQKRGPLNAEQMRLLNSIKEGIRKLTVFSNQFLDIQKIEHGSMEYHFRRVCLPDVLMPVVEDAQILAAQKDIRLECFIDDGLPELLADAEKISQVFSNLLSNAVKYTEAEGTITVRATKTATGIAVSVADTGAGIPKEDLPRIFTKFYQARNAKKGTGIGLALVKHLVEAHKGRVSVESELGKGTVFTVELPAAPPEQPQPSQHVVTEGTA